MKDDNLLTNGWPLLIRSQSRKTLLRPNPEIFNSNKRLLHTRVHSCSLQSRWYYSPGKKCTEDESMHLRFGFIFWSEECISMALINKQHFSPKYLQHFLSLSNCRYLYETLLLNCMKAPILRRVTIIKHLVSTGTQELTPGKRLRRSANPPTITAVARVIFKVIYYFTYALNQQHITFITEIDQVFHVPDVTTDLCRQSHTSSGQHSMVVM